MDFAAAVGLCVFFVCRTRVDFSWSVTPHTRAKGSAATRQASKGKRVGGSFFLTAPLSEAHWYNVFYFVMCSSIYRFMSWAHCQKSPTLIRKCLAWQPHAAQHVFLNIWIMPWQIVHAGPNEPRLTGPMSLHQQLLWFEWTHGIRNKSDIITTTQIATCLFFRLQLFE